MTIDINQYQSISINRLILIIDDQSMAKIHVVIDLYRFPITINRLINIDWYRLVADFVTFQNLLACVQTSPISFASSGKWTTDVPFSCEAKEIGDVCTQAKNLQA